MIWCNATCVTVTSFTAGMGMEMGMGTM